MARRTGHRDRIMESVIRACGEVLNDQKLGQIADKYGKTISQVILRWHIQLGAIPIPKSASPERQLENISVFDFSLDENDMNIIDSLTRPHGRINGQDPAEYEEF
ncbi:aldo/keto reductase [Bacillus velezensis]|uniref:aldo/keto reductase n=1 Tax=Bacillus velezensis TaxID=492670 RepID=UPI003877F30F